MDKILELQKKIIDSLSVIYEDEVRILKYQYKHFKFLFDIFANEWIYFLLLEKDNIKNSKNFFYWDNLKYNYFQTTFWKFNKILVPYNKNKGKKDDHFSPLYFHFYDNWSFKLHWRIQTSQKEATIFDRNILQKISERIPSFKYSWNKNTKLGNEEQRVSYVSNDEINDFSLIKKYFIIIDEILSKIEWADRIEKNDFIITLENRLKFIEKNNNC